MKFFWLYTYYLSLLQSLMLDATERDSEEGQKKMSKVTEMVKFQMSSLHSSSRMHDDGVILPQDTRKVCAMMS